MPLACQDLPSAATGWVKRELSLKALRGTRSPERERNSIVGVLASVSGGRSVYGSVLLLPEISWTDRITKRRRSVDILRSHAATLRKALKGAEIGSLREGCRQ